MATIHDLFRKHVERHQQSKAIHGYFLRSLEEREMYAKKRVEIKGQRSLFEDEPEEEVVQSIVPIARKVVEETFTTKTVKVPHRGRKVVEKRILKPTEHWITLHSKGGGGGARVIVNGNGEITGGTASLVGKKISDLFKKKPKSEESEKAVAKQDGRPGDYGMAREGRLQRWINAGVSEHDADWMSKMSWNYLTPEEQELFNNAKGSDHDHELLETDSGEDDGNRESGMAGTSEGRSGEVSAREDADAAISGGSGSVPESASNLITAGDATDAGLGDGTGSGDRIGNEGSLGGTKRRGSSGRLGNRRSRSGHGSGDGSDTGSLTESPSVENPTDVSAGNWRYSTRDFANGGVKAKFQNNLEAIRTLRAIQEEGRDTATPAEQEAMSKFVGWGQMPGLFNERWDQAREAGISYDEFRDNRDKWGDERKDLKAVMSPGEYESARKATLNSHFTHPDVVDAHWKMAQKMGFAGGRFLEPSAGIGYYIGQIPISLAPKTRVSAVELDKSTGGMLKMLYPAANVEVQGFEDHQSPKGFYDLVASNVPFGDYSVHDCEYNKHRARIHDYFFLKSADLTKPGGMVMHVTSTGTMDKQDDKIRQELAKTCDFVAAVRFPGGAHKANAGTEVVTDMILLRKRYPNEKPVTLEETPTDAMPDELGFTGTTTDSLGRVYHWVDGKRVPGPQWMDVKEVPDPDGGDPIVVNEYFADHPEQILGRLDRSGTIYHGQNVNVSKTDDYEQMLQAAIDRLPEGVFSTGMGVPKNEPEQRVATEGVKDGGYVIHDGKLYRREGGGEVEQKASAALIAKVSGQLAIRDARQAVVDAELAGESADEARVELNRVYDEYVDKYGPLSSRDNKNAMKDDPDSPNLLALEKWDAARKTASKADMFSQETIRQHEQVDYAENVPEAVGVVLNETGGIDPERIAELTDKDVREVERELTSSGLAFEDPQEGWKAADRYLSGNVRRKLVMARAAAASDPKFAANVKALEQVQPEDIDYQDIDIKLGASWISPADIQKFAGELGHYPQTDMTVNYIPETGEWQFAWNRKRHTEAIRQSQTKRKTFDEIIEAILNSRSLAVYDTEDDGSRTFNVEETAAVQEKANEIKEKFGQWVWEDDERRQRLHRYYNDNFNNIRNIAYDGSHLTFPGMNPKFADRAIRKNFAWEVITTGRGLAAHEVGTGKSLTMIASAMELRRLGLAKKPCLVCLKSNIEQITKEALEGYPGAKILSTVGKFDAANRKKTIAQIATGDYDLIIMTHDNIDLLGMRPEVEQGYIRQELDSLIEAREAAWHEDMNRNNRVVKALEKATAKLEAKLKKSIESEGKDDAVYFEETGIDQLFVDESHKYKSLNIITRGERIKGIPQSNSDRATNMHMRCRWLMDRNGGRGVVFATGTPVANTMAELYNIQRYLQPNELKERGIQSFDAWANQFGDRVTQMEATVTGDYAPVTRFSKFVNIPELMQIAGQVMDVQRADNLKNPDGTPVIVRPRRQDRVVTTPENDQTRRMMEELQKRAREMKGKRAEKGADNMAVICSDGRKGSCDPRMLYADAPDDPSSKVNRCVDNVLKLHQERPGVTQLIFSNVGVNPSPQTGFHMYGDVIEKLVKGGIPREKIADFSKLEGAKKDAAQEAMKRGDVLVGIGSTETLGTGVNVQEKLAALHHLDVPWQPAEIEQRDGRGYRSGNRNDHTKSPKDQKVDIYRYVAEGSLDTFMWQVVANKAHFINQIINGKDKTTRSVSDDDTQTLTPEQLMAVASGDPRILQKVQLDSDLRELKRGSDRHHQDQSKLRDQLKHYETTVVPTEESVQAKHATDMRHVADAGDEFSMKLKGKSFADRKAASEAFDKHIQTISDVPRWDRRAMSEPIGEYKGFKIHIPEYELRFGDDENINRIDLEGPSGHKYPARPSLASMDAILRGISIAHRNQATRVEQLKKDVQVMRENVGKPYRRSEEFDEKQRLLRDLEKDLQKTNDPVTPVPAVEEQSEQIAKYSMASAVDRIVMRFQAEAEAILSERYSKSSETVDAKPDRKFSSTQVDIPDLLAKKLSAMGAKIPDGDLAEDGREDHFHITAKYGLHTNNADEVKEAVYGQRPFVVTLGKLSLFENPDANVLKIDIEPSDDEQGSMWTLNKKIADACEHTDTHSSYKPHITLAYLRPGLGKKYLRSTDLDGATFKADRLFFSGKDRNVTEIPFVSEGWPASMEDRLDYAKRKAAAGQQSMFDEDLHPRNESGEFTAKEDSVVVKRQETHWKGDRAEYTGNMIDGMHEIEMMEGVHKGSKKLTSTSPGGTNPLHEQNQKEWKDQQDGFRRLRESQQALFSHEDLTGQKSLFDVGTPTIKPKRSAQDKRFELGPSIPEKFAEEQKSSKITPLDNQKDLFSRVESAEIAYRATKREHNGDE